jgi:uncharacterized protein with PIN domain
VVSERVTSEFRFYEELNRFVAPALRKRDFAYAVAPGASVKHAIEALGVPLTEVELILVDGVSVGFDHPLAGGERVAVYPKFEAFDIASLLRVREAPLRSTRFVADAHLGRLARHLRFLGYDTLYHNAWHDRELVERARAEQRIVLTRDRELLKRRDVTHGCYLHATAPLEQLRELVQRLELHAPGAEPRCLECNGTLEAVPKEAVDHRLPPRTRAAFDAFWRCAGCDRVYWRGSHWQRLRGRLAAALA